MERINLTLFNPQQGNTALRDAWPHIKSALMAGFRLTVEIKPETRSNEQNKRLWVMLTEVSRQVDWYGQKLSAEDWKHIFSSAMKKQRAVPGIDGGFVVLGQSTSKMTKAEMSEMQEMIEAFGIERGVNFNFEQQ